MRFIGYTAGFLAIAYIAVPHIAAHDPEPIGAEASLGLFGFVAWITGFAPFFLLTSFRKIRHELPLSAVSGALACGGFYFAQDAIFHVSSLGVAAVGGLCVCMAVSAALAYAVRVKGNGVRLD